MTILLTDKSTVKIYQYRSSSGAEMKNKKRAGAKIK